MVDNHRGISLFFFIVVISTIISMTSCLYGPVHPLNYDNLPPEKDLPSTVFPILKTHLGEGPIPYIEFAANNEPFILLSDAVYHWDSLHPNPSVKYKILNFDGKEVWSVNKNGEIHDFIFKHLFPGIRLTKMYNSETMDPIFKKKKNDATYTWGFSKDWQYGLRFTSNFKNGFKNKHIFELFDLKNNKKSIWLIEVDCFGAPEFIEFIEWEKKKAILLCMFDEIIILSQDNGDIYSKVSYGLPNTEENLNAYKKRICGPWCMAYDRYDDGDREYKFMPWCMAYDLRKRTLVCGDNNSRRVRVISIDPPNKTIAELNAGTPHDGWYTLELRFAGENKYLIIEYWNHGMIRSYDIYDTETWKLCMQIFKPEIMGLTISPDGKEIAFTRGSTLEIYPFSSNLCESNLKN